MATDFVRHFAHDGHNIDLVLDLAEGDVDIIMAADPWTAELRLVACSEAQISDIIVSSRVKHAYSVYMKMKKRKKEIDEIFYGRNLPDIF